MNATLTSHPPVVLLFQTHYQYPLRRTQEFHAFVFDHPQVENQRAALKLLFAFSGIPQLKMYSESEPSALFQFDGADSIEANVMDLEAAGKIDPYLCFTHATPDEAVDRALEQLNFVATQYGEAGRAMYLERLLASDKLPCFDSMLEDNSPDCWMFGKDPTVLLLFEKAWVASDDNFEALAHWIANIPCEPDMRAALILWLVDKRAKHPR